MSMAGLTCLIVMAECTYTVVRSTCMQHMVCARVHLELLWH